MRKIVWLGSGAAALLIVVVAVLGLRGFEDNAATGATSGRASKERLASAALPVPPVAAKPAARPLPTPSFDVVTVDPQGQAVIAGRSAPGDHIRVLDGDKPVGEVTANERGEWVLVPTTPMQAGNRQLSLEATGRDGGPPRRSGDVLALAVQPRSPAQRAAALAVLVPDDAAKPVRVLQSPNGAAMPQKLSLDSAEYGAGAHLALAGHADPGARLNIYGGERLLGSATADAAGNWSLTAAGPPPKDGGEVRVDQLDPAGAVVHRVAAPFGPAGKPTAKAGTYIVQRGNSLWLIARQLYGEGVRYTAIYSANRDQIRDPAKIYPGQQFKLPPS